MVSKSVMEKALRGYRVTQDLPDVLLEDLFDADAERMLADLDEIMTRTGATIHGVVEHGEASLVGVLLLVMAREVKQQRRAWKSAKKEKIAKRKARVSWNPNAHGGSPYIAGADMTTEHIYDMIVVRGLTKQKVLAQCPGLNAQEIDVALAWEERE